MATVSGNIYKVVYDIITPNASTTDPPTVVSGPTIALVNCASVAAIQAVLVADVGLTGSQTVRIIDAEIQCPGALIYQ